MTALLDIMEADQKTQTIRDRLAAGERASALAAEFGISRQRVHQIAHPDREKKRVGVRDRRRREREKS